MDQSHIQAKAEMLIRRPVAEVFEAFVNPEITTKFWFTRGSARLEAGKQVQWDWQMYNTSIRVNVREVEQNKRILLVWPGHGSPTLVEWIFTPHGKDAAFVSITNSGFSGGDDEVVKDAIASTGGFTLVLAGAKAYLEHNLELNLTADRFPRGLERG
jgi:uncharacterized protein YndB with AHSA1/START domain